MILTINSTAAVASKMDLVNLAAATDSSTTSSKPNSTIMISLTVSLVIFLSLVIVIVIAVVYISFQFYKRRQSTSLSNLTKPHKESEENSYASSEHSREFSSKQLDSLDPGYDVIKMEHLKEVALKSAQLDNNSKSILFSKDNPFKDEYLDGDLLYSTICSSDDDAHKIVSSDRSEQENKMLPGANETPQSPVHKHTYSSHDGAPSLPPHTVEMMYTVVQKRPKDSVEIEDEGDAPPIPPYTGEEYHTAGT